MEIQEVKGLIPVEWHNQRVLTTAQVAKNLKCKPSRIKDNFRLAKDQFQEGLHYFRVTGEELHLLKHSEGFAPLAISKMTSCLYLWTYRGCVRHCKMINTPEAWQVFDVLERVYFGVIKGEIPLEVAEVAPVEEKEVDTLTARIKKQIARPCSELAVVYALLMSNLTVKIGMTKDLTDRIKQIKAETKLDVLDFYSSRFLPREDAIILEAALKDKFSVDCLGGEFFDTKFSLVAAEL